MTFIQKTLLFSTFFLFGCQSINIPLLTKGDSKQKTRKERTQSPEASSAKELVVAKPKSRSKKRKGKSRKSTIRNEIVQEAAKYKGIKYKYGGKKPSTGFDCSGFSTFVFAQKGISLHGSSRMLAEIGAHRSYNAIETGDLAFFGTNGKVTHVAIVLNKTNSEFKVIHSTSSKGVITSDLLQSKYWMGKYLFSKDVLSNLEYGISGLD